MASSIHQFILGLLIKQMRIAHYEIFSVEGKFIGEAHDIIKIPPTVVRHRPDALGISVSGRVCIGEAKTFSDVGSKRTKEQIIDYTSTELNGKTCEIFLGIPADAEHKLNTLLRKLSLDNYKYLHILRVPNEFLK